jgi:nucleotide-binding universal stress UspA family protein
LSKYSKILVPYDGSKPSDRALECAISIAKISMGKITLFQVVEEIFLPPMIRTPHVRSTKTGEIISMSQLLKELHQDLKNEALTKLQKLEEKCGKARISTESIIGIGYPAEKIIEHVKDKQIDLVIIGTSGLTGISKIATIGSVARGVSERATCPVILVH